MRRWPVYGLGLALLWLLVRGVALEPTAIVGEGLIGLAVGLPLSFALRRFYPDTVDFSARLAGVPYAVVYVLLFLKDLLLANVEVAYRVLSPSLPIHPDVVEVPLRVESDVAITTIANSITLTPGTLTMDYDAEHNSLMVHAIDGRDYESIVAPIRRWEDYALRIFDEEREPSDPVPRSIDGDGETPPVTTDGNGGDDE
ncbi:MAG: Na+/H+ antiporter subunit E [Haloarculaceae archaeon]